MNAAERRANRALRDANASASTLRAKCWPCQWEHVGPQSKSAAIEHVIKCGTPLYVKDIDGRWTLRS